MSCHFHLIHGHAHCCLISFLPCHLLLPALLHLPPLPASHHDGQVLHEQPPVPLRQRSFVTLDDCMPDTCTASTNRCSDDLLLAQIVTLVLAFRSRATFLHTSMILISLSLLNDHWIDETISFKMSQDFLLQILVTTFPSAHEADHYSTARFHDCDTWLSFALCHCSNEHEVCLEFRQCIRCLVHHNSSVRRTSSTTRTTDRTPISEWNMCRVVCHSRSICGEVEDVVGALTPVGSGVAQVFL